MNELQEMFQGYMWALIVVAVFIGIFAAVAIFAAIWKWVLGFKYLRYQNQETAAKLTGKEVAEKMLQGLGINDVTVVKCGFWATLFLGNSYSPFKKKIRLRRKIYNNKSLAAVAVASQKVAIAYRDHQGDKKIKVRSVLMGLSYFAPFAVLPLVIIGLLIDFLAYKELGVFTVILSAIAIVIYLASFIVVCLNIPIEKKANKQALEFIKKVNLLTESELEKAQDLFRAYMINYVLDFISELLYIIWRIIQFVCKIIVRNKNK